MNEVKDPIAEMERVKRLADLLSDSRSQSLLTKYMTELEYEVARVQYGRVLDLVN